MFAAGEVLLGVALVAASGFAFWSALPRDGKVRPFLRNEHAQTYFCVVTIVAFAFGLVTIIIGLAP
jgi:hypothetical protein